MSQIAHQTVTELRHTHGRVLATSQHLFLSRRNRLLAVTTLVDDTPGPQLPSDMAHEEVFALSLDAAQVALIIDALRSLDIPSRWNEDRTELSVASKHGDAVDAVLDEIMGASDGSTPGLPMIFFQEFYLRSMQFINEFQRTDQHNAVIVRGRGRSGPNKAIARLTVLAEAEAEALEEQLYSSAGGALKDVTGWAAR